MLVLYVALCYNLKKNRSAGNTPIFPFLNTLLFLLFLIHLYYSIYWLI